MHAPYACRHAGACCSSGWPIPLEQVRVAPIAHAIAEGQIEAPVPWMLPSADQPAEVAGLLGVRQGRCVFHRTAPGALDRRCTIQLALGPTALPAACQHFPRECLIDDRGVFVTLSHYCPTAAALLVSHRGPIAIVPGPDPIPGGSPEGLDARGAWPPLLGPGLLMDLTSYSVWEAHVVSWLGGERNPAGRWLPEDVLAMLDRQARALSAWRPGHGALIDAVHALAPERPALHDADPMWVVEHALRETARQALPPPLTAPVEMDDVEEVWTRDVHSSWTALAAVVNRLLAAHGFASWMTYQGSGLVSHVRALRLTLAVLRGEAARQCRRDGGPLTESRLIDAVRRTDLLLVHLVDRVALAGQLS